MPALTAKQQRRAEQLAKRKEEKKRLKQRGLPLPGSNAAAVASDQGGGMSLAGIPSPGCVPLV